MGQKSRNKGAQFEREIANSIAETLGVKVKRNLEQYRAKDQGDLDGLPGWTIECKRYASGNVQFSWWEQVTKAAKREGNMPVLIYRFDRQLPRCRIPLQALNPAHDDWLLAADVDFPTWCKIVEARDAV